MSATTEEKKEGDTVTDVEVGNQRDVVTRVRTIFGVEIAYLMRTGTSWTGWSRTSDLRKVPAPTDDSAEIMATFCDGLYQGAGRGPRK